MTEKVPNNTSKKGESMYNSAKKNGYMGFSNTEKRLNARIERKGGVQEGYGDTQSRPQKHIHTETHI